MAECPAVASEHAIEALGLVKRYGAKLALDQVDLEVARGSVCGLLGPNGAGKTTAVRILTTLTSPDAGTAHVAGHDVMRDPAAVGKSGSRRRTRRSTGCSQGARTSS
jgi:ABC-2 type transport system ATP-binding protein